MKGQSDKKPDRMVFECCSELQRKKEGIMKRLIKNGTVIGGSGQKRQDILMDDVTGTICMVADRIDMDLENEAAEIIDASGKLIFPGFIDAHTHFDLEVSGTVTADDFASGTRAAVSGGTTTIIDFATQNRGETLTEALANWHKKADGRCSCDYGFHMAISDWNDKISRELEIMIREGVTSFKLYMTYDNMVLDDKAIYQVLKRLKQLGGIAGVHCENKGLIDALVEEEKALGHFAPSSHPKTRPDLAEAEAVDRLLKLAKAAEAPVIVVHLSTAAGYEEAALARSKGQEVYLETCPQYLVMDERRYEEPGFEGAKYVCSPPLRKTADQECLWKALKEDRIQTIATDHCSFTLEQKAAGKDDFSRIPNGMPGTETRPAVIYTCGVRKQRISLEQMCRLLSEQPARLYGLYPRKGCIAPGSDADLVIWNPEASRTLSVENQQANTDYCPLEGMEVSGMAEQVYLRGQLAAESGKVVKEHTGRFLKREKYQTF